MGVCMYERERDFSTAGWYYQISSKNPVKELFSNWLRDKGGLI